MVTEKELRELVNLSDNETPMVSLYLNVDPARRAKEEYRLTLRKLVKDVSAKIPPEDVSRIERYLDFEYDWQGKSVAVFSCAQRKIWRAYPLAMAVEDQIHVLTRPYIEPLSYFLDRFGRYVVALVGREGVRLFLFQGGQLEDSAGTFGPLPGRHKQGGWAAQRFQRHADEVAQHNLRDGADLMVRFCENAGCNRLLLAGTDENIHLFEDLLPKAWRSQIIGTFILDATASETEVLEHSLEVVRGADEERKQRLVGELVTAAAKKGGMAAIGLADTLSAVQDGRARIVVVADGYKSEGYRCTQCGFISAQPVEKCNFCGGGLEHISDAVNGLIHKAVEGGLEVEVIRNNEALQAAGSIGALLRY